MFHQLFRANFFAALPATALLFGTTAMAQAPQTPPGADRTPVLLEYIKLNCGVELMNRAAVKGKQTPGCQSDAIFDAKCQATLRNELESCTRNNPGNSNAKDQCQLAFVNNVKGSMSRIPYTPC